LAKLLLVLVVQLFEVRILQGLSRRVHGSVLVLGSDVSQSFHCLIQGRIWLLTWFRVNGKRCLR
jgi:hypothetical protein